MFSQILADMIVLLHFLFILFVILGGFLALWSKKWLIIQLPAVIWAATIEFKGWICPLTPLENWLREKSGHEIYKASFIEQYLIPIIYPATLTERMQIILGITVILINASTYFWVYHTSGNKNK